MSLFEVAAVPRVEQGAALQSPRLTCSPRAAVAEPGGCCLPLPGSRWGEAGARWLAEAWPAPGMLWPHSQNPALGVCLLLRPRGLVLL